MKYLSNKKCKLCLVRDSTYHSGQRQLEYQAYRSLAWEKFWLRMIKKEIGIITKTADKGSFWYSREESYPFCCAKDDERLTTMVWRRVQGQLIIGSWKGQYVNCRPKGHRGTFCFMVACLKGPDGQWQVALKCTAASQNKGLSREQRLLQTLLCYTTVASKTNAFGYWWLHCHYPKIKGSQCSNLVKLIYIQSWLVASR